MNYKLILRDKAVFEMEDAYDFCENKLKGLGKKFLKSIEEYLSKIETNPKYFPQKFSTIREAFIKKFPFVIVYEIHDETIVVYSIFHTSRNPENKK